MVLESVVADLLNRFLGGYVENLNKSQLKLGIWGGNVALENLLIKENALSELDVPFRVKAGQIDKLTLKIPWKNLYGEAVVATLEGLYLLVVPGASIKYDAEKEEKYLQDNKQKELARIEDALRKAAEKGDHSDFIYGLENIVYKEAKPGRKSKKAKKRFKKPFKGHDHAKDKPKEEKKDTFLEKLATQVIKNVQVKITSIHVKYEDDITDPSRPLSFGMTLGELSLLTANEHWTPCILNEAAKIIYKLLRLDALSVYWNVDSEMYYHASREEILERLKKGVPSPSQKLPNDQYIFKPVSASAKLYLNPHAETELQTPKMDWSMEVQSIAIELTKPQVSLCVTFRSRAQAFPLGMWKYAGNSILEVHIRRCSRMWSWSNIRHHRQLLRNYKNAYKNRLTQTKVSEETQKQLQDLEKGLDVFNIILARQQAQTEVIRSGQKLLRKKSADGEKKGGGWFSGLWGRKDSKKKDDEEEPSVPETIDDLMTPEEKAKLFTAIGYSDSSHNLALPKQYVAHVMSLKLLSTSFTIKEDRNVPDTLKIQIIDLSTTISQRPGAQALKVEAKLEHWYVTGLKQKEVVPSLVASIGDTRSSLLKIAFETNPEGSSADQSLSVESQPVEIIYDARTINALVDFFRTNKGMDLERLTTATLSKLEEIKERTATGLTHIIETRKVLDLRINLKPSYLLVPQTGFHYDTSNLLILDFGAFQLNSIHQGGNQAPGTSLEEIMDQAYDKFDVEIKNVQLLFGRSGEDWKKARLEHPSALHILRPMDIRVQLAKSMVEKDIRMPKFKVCGELPLVHLGISDRKIQGVFQLLESIPFPQKSAATSAPSTIKGPAIPVVTDTRKAFLGTPLLLEGVASESDDEYFDADEESGANQSVKPVKAEAAPKHEELTDLQLKFEIREVVLELTKQLQREEKVLVFSVRQLGLEAVLRTYDLRAVSYLRKISLDYYETQGKRQQLHLISSSDKPGLDLLKVEYTKADVNGPKFQTTFDNTEQTVQVAFSSLNLLLHTQALLSTINYLLAVLPAKKQDPLHPGVSQAQGGKPGKEAPVSKKAAKPSKDKDVFDFKFFAKLDAFCISVCDEKNNIADIRVQGLNSSLFLQSSQTTLFARLKDIVVTDVDSKTVHKKAVSIVGDEVFSFNLALYPEATEGDAYSDMSKVDGMVSLKVGCIQIIYLHKFLMSLLNFLDSFQVAKEALSAATEKAAERAATSVRDLAQRSFRLAMDINLKAPVIFVPQSSVSFNAVVVDLGLIKVQNKFSLVPAKDCPLPPVVDRMEVQLTQLKMARTILQPGFSQPDIPILHPINLNLSVNRNLAGSWYHRIPMMEVKGYLDVMDVVLNQEDLNVLLKILTENLAEADKTMGGTEPGAPTKEFPSSPKGLSAPPQKDAPLNRALATSKETTPEDVTNMLLNFEIKKVIRSGQKLLRKKSADGEKKGGGWFSGLWGRKDSKKKDDEEEPSVPETIDDLMTPEEKAKLFTAIGYSDSSHNLALPKQYVAHVMSLKLLSTSFTIKEDRNVPDTLKIQIIDLSTTISQRPGAQALKVEAKLEHWYVTGLKQKEVVPSLVASIGDTRSSLLKIAFETNPEGSSADQSLSVESQPVEIIYDARTINALVDFFRTNKGMDLERLTTATLSKLEEIKERTATGLTHIIETRKVLDLRINLKPSYLLVPQTGFHYDTSNLLILDFGAFQLNSIHQGGNQAPGTSLEEIMDQAYDKFDVEIKNVQLLFGRSGEDWKKARLEHPSALHILRPMDIRVQLAKSMVEKDIRMPKFKVCGELPLVHLGISDRKIQGVFQLLESIPFPQKSAATSAPSTIKGPAIPVVTDTRKAFLGTPLLLEGVASESDDEYFDADEESGANQSVKPVKAEAAPKHEELTDLQLKFEIREVVLELTKQLQREEKVLVFSVRQLGLEAVLRTYDLRAVSYLRKISLDYYETQGKRQQLHLISSSDKPGLDLLKVEYTKADVNGPKFQTTFDNTEQTVQVAFSSLNLLLHTQALLSTINYLLAVLPAKKQDPLHPGVSQAQGGKPGKEAPVSKKAAKPSKDKDVFDFKFFAKLDAFCISVCDEKNNIADIRVQGLNSSLFLQSSQTTLFARLKDIVVTDVDSKTVHKKAVSIVGDEVFSFNLALYPEATEGDAYSDMSKVDGMVSLKVGCIQIIYLHKFLMSLLNFLDSFQVAKEALSAATEKAAERAATSVRDLAQRSFRLAMDINLKAPVIFVPQSSVSFNAVVVDLGLIKVQNKFSLVPAKDCPLPPVVDRMEVQLTQLKMARTILQPGFSQPDIPILHPINLNLSVNRNLAGSWYHRIPMMEVKGYLDVMDVVLNQEDLNVLLKILTENLAEADKTMGGTEPGAPTKEFPSSPKGLSAPPQKDAPLNRALATSKETTPEDVTNMLLNFEIKKVVITLTKRAEQRSLPLHQLTILQLGTEGRIKSHDLTATAYLKKIDMKCLEFTDSKGNPLNIVSSSDDSGKHLLKMEYIKADADGPHFETVYKNTKQVLDVSFSSLDLLLHMDALLSIMNFFLYASSGFAATEKGTGTKLPSEEPLRTVLAKTAPVPAALDNVFDLKLMARLSAFNIWVCDQQGDIADMRIQGMEASVFTMPKQTEVFARLRDFVVINVDPKAVHKKTVSIVGDEVFRFALSLYPEATAGDAYTDMSKVDSRMSLKVGCIQIVYLHQFFMSLLNFLNHFQAAKEALSTATAQAAERAASSMKDFAQKSFRLSMEVNLKAPVIVIPQSSVSRNALVADLGLITVQNAFRLVPGDTATHPPIIDNMEIQLTQLKISRTLIAEDSQPEIEILQPVNLQLSVQRNLAAAWYLQIPGIAVKGDLKAMQISLSQDDLTLLMKILLENLGEASTDPRATPSASSEAQKLKKSKGGMEADHEKDNLTTSGEKNISEAKPKESVTLLFEFNFESLSIVLFNAAVDQKSQYSLHDNSLRLGELCLHLMTATGQMFSSGSMGINTKLKTCTLDDLREGVQRATSRMIDKKDSGDDSVMMDISYTQDKSGTEIVSVLDKLYLCASVEFLLTVADFFVKAMPAASSPSEKSAQFHLKQGKPKPEKDESQRSNVSMVARITDPEVVFVANLTKADAPALSASFQCDFSLSSGPLAQRMTAQVRELRVLACPFLHGKGEKSLTTVVQPCSLTMEAMMHSSGMQAVDVVVEEFIVKISPKILNTVMTIMAAMKAKPRDDESGGATCSPVDDLWSVKPVDRCQYWFLGVDMATEATEAFLASEASTKQESFHAQVRSIQVTLECGLGHRTVPLLLVESTFAGTVTNWSSLLAAQGDMTLEVHYYNETYAVWEPLIERTEKEKSQWKLKLEMKTNPEQDQGGLLPGDDFVVLPEPQSAIHISSKDTMNITISKASLAVFDNLAKGFSEGAGSTYNYTLKDRAPFTLKNALGLPLKVHTCRSLQVIGSATGEDIHDVRVGETLELDYAALEPQHRGKLSAFYRQESSLFTLSFGPHGYTEVANVPIAKPGRRLYNVRAPERDHSDSVVVQIDAEEGNKVITIRSPLQIKNHFSVPFIVYKFVRDGRLLEPIGVSKPEEEFHVPLDSYRCQLFVQPTGVLKGRYEPSRTFISWREELHRSSEVCCMLQCPATEASFLPLVVNSTAVPDALSFIATNGEDWDPAYILHLHPTLTLRNLLPYSLRYLLERTAETHELPEGSTADVLQATISGEIMELVLSKYQGKDWSGHFRVSDNLPEFFPVRFTSDSTDTMTVDIYIHVRRVGSRMVLSVYSPYWIINKTSRVLQYRAEDVHVKHPADYRDIVLFSFKKKNIFSKNKIQLSISTSTWSNSFSLDTVGSYGCVKCPANSMDFLVGVSIKMSSFNLTRIVTLTPFYTIANKSSLELEVGEMGADGSMPTNKWSYFSSSECLPFWPENLSGKLCLRVVGCDRVSRTFFYNRQDNGTLLSLEELNTGILVDVNVSEHSIVITFSDYHEGAAPALIINHTPWVALKYKQSGSQEEVELKPREVRLFAWADPTGVRKLSWAYAQNFGEDDLLKDNCGQFPYNSNTQIHWVSFLDGRQRVLLFTEDVALVSKARQAEELEQPEQEVSLALHSLGLSLVNNQNKQEISYIGITSSGIVWEWKPKQRWKPFNQKQIGLLEQAYQRHLSGGGTEGWVRIEGSFEVNFNKTPMEMRLPLKCSIKRDFLSGIQIEFKQSRHQKSLRAQLYWLQVDNQLPGSMFPVVFHPVAPPKSVAMDSEPKPFVDVSVIIRFNEYSKVMQFKYFMVLIQEMALKIDQGFLGAIMGLFTPSTDPEADKQRMKLIQKDVDALNTQLMESSLTDISPLSFFEHFHISPLKLHLSLSLGAGGEASDQGKGEMIAIHSVNLLLKSIGATLTDVDDLIFKLAFFEIRYQFYKRDELMWRVIGHYRDQFLKQMYVLVLGLDVLGNPFGLIRGLSEGVEAFFYEPFQGAVQGPEEFAEGFVIGVRSLLGHTVGGAAGVVSRITGSVGKGLAAITMDKEYQQKRREEMGRQPKDFGDSLAKGGKGLLRGVVGGVTGIITKPVEGAKKEGATGFFTGIGKGLVGVVARPVGGIVDMASSTFQGIQRVAESTEEVSKLRPPRLICEDGIIRPYDRAEAEGYDLFENSHIKKLAGESFCFHCTAPGGRKANVVVTNRRVMLIKEVEILGHITTDWDYSYEDFTRPPAVTNNVLHVYVKDQGLFQKRESSRQESVKNIKFADAASAKRVCQAIDEAQASRHQQKLVKQASLRLSRS
nr:intermembrane lipid transfer protein VPS13C [Anolis sagrei ordinatus]